MYTLEGFVVDEMNELAAEKVLGIAEGDGSKKVFVHGAPNSGKTHLLYAAKEKVGPRGVYCATSDFMIRLDLGVDDAFFERIGSIPILCVDVFEGLFAHSDAPELMRLLLSERERLGFATVVASRFPLNHFEMGEGLRAEFDSFLSVEMASLSKKGRCAAIDVFIRRYGTDASPRISDDAVGFLVDSFEVVSDLENAVHYLQAGAGLSADDTVNAAVARELLNDR